MGLKIRWILRREEDDENIDGGSWVMWDDGMRRSKVHG